VNRTGRSAHGSGLRPPNQPPAPTRETGDGGQGAGDRKRASVVWLAMLSIAVVTAVAAVSLAGTRVASGGPEERFREATALIHKGDVRNGVAVYRELAANGEASASLYWNWSQAAAARGELGEALWALLRARELQPGDRAVGREIDHLRDTANLDPAELAPDPLASVERVTRWLHLDLLAVVFLVMSLVLHGFGRWRRAARWPGPAAASAFAVGACLTLAALAGSFAGPTAVVVRRGAPLFDAASQTANQLGTLREGEVVPILERSGDHLRVEDSSGASGWAGVADVWPLDGPPGPAAGSPG
jgi:hypothetical protein